MYSIHADPSDGKSNHWSNAPKQEWDGLCLTCKSEVTDDTPPHIRGRKMYVCDECGEYFEIE